MKAVIVFLFLSFLYGNACFGQYDSLQPQGIYSSNFIIDGQPRNITYYMPRNYGKLEAYPLLIVLHDANSTAVNTIKKYGEQIHSKADSADCVVMYPDALGGNWHKTQQSAVGTDLVNDVSFISIMLTFFVQQYHCDAERVYFIGVGEGGTMSYKYRCEASVLPAAIATINATDTNGFADCKIKSPIPVTDIKSETGMKPAFTKALDFVFTNHKNGNWALHFRVINTGKKYF